jgi:integral membrane sensor domain MASE1
MFLIRHLISLARLMAFPPLHRRSFRLASLASLSFVGFFLLGYGGILIAGGNGNQSSPLWPATAFGLCVLIRLSRSRADDVAILAAILLAGICANALGGANPVLVIGFSLINLLDVLAGLMAMRKLVQPRFKTLPSALRFALAAAISPSLVGALLSYVLVRWIGGNALLTGIQWFFANVLAVCILFPFGMTVSLRQFRKAGPGKPFLGSTGGILSGIGFCGAIISPVHLSAAIFNPGGGRLGYSSVSPDGRRRRDNHHKRRSYFFAASVRHQ